MHEQQHLEPAGPRTAVGFIGLGNIGKPMAARLLSQGYGVVSCAHVRRDAIEELQAMGLIEVASPRQVAAATHVVITMVRNTQETEGVIFGEQGILAGMPQGATLIIMSTIDPQCCRRVAAQAAAQGVAVLDAPVSGGAPGAAQGTLALMVGGSAPSWSGAGRSSRHWGGSLPAVQSGWGWWPSSPIRPSFGAPLPS